eukprot:SAG22_NODE_4068_length_1398_cov_1.254042_2_plen_280_part_00
MVLVQIVAMYGIVFGMTNPTCVSNAQCGKVGTFCATSADGVGVCRQCGQDPPLVPYISSIPIEREVFHGMTAGRGCRQRLEGDPCFKEVNKIYDQSYPHFTRGMKRSDAPDGFAGFNFTMVKNRCTAPIEGIRWSIEAPADRGLGGAYSMSERGDLQPEFTPSEKGTVEFPAKAVKSWCEACVRSPGPNDVGRAPDPLHENGLSVYDNVTGLQVSVMNSKKDAVDAVNAMSWPDWFALLLCSYVVGMTVVGEIKVHLLAWAHAVCSARCALSSVGVSPT